MLVSMLVDPTNVGLIVTGPPNCARATAPESLANNQFSLATDVYHFGLTVCELLTGGSYENQWLPQVAQVDAPTRYTRLMTSAAKGHQDILAHLPSWTPTPLADIMRRCLSVDPTKRPTMQAVAAELQTLRANRCPVARADRPSILFHTR